MSYIPIDHHDARYDTVKKGFNLRWPSPGQEAQRILICNQAADARQAIEFALLSGLRPTIRSGGHCYEGFVSNNPGGVIVDIGNLTGIEANVTESGRRYAFRVAAGQQNWNAYLNLYKNFGKTIPGGSCYSVGFGGHICGGGYGLLSRLHGLTVDWLSGVDIVIANGRSAQPVHANATQHPDLFKLCRGGGGNNAGLITHYYFDDLPVAPRQVVVLLLQFPWAQFTGANRARFDDFVTAYGDFLSAADREPDTYGLFTILKLTHVSAGNIGLVVQYTDRHGGIADLGPLQAFMKAIAPFEKRLQNAYLPGAGQPFVGTPPGALAARGLPDHSQAMDWLYATQTFNSSGNNQRGKYKSAYMKHRFTQHELDALHHHLTDVHKDDPDFAQSLVQIDSYGGAINHVSSGNPHFDPARNETAVPQRRSIMKLQYQTYWTEPANDAKHLTWMRDLYYAVYRHDGFNGTPYPDSAALPGSRYEGCYINYPDVDMLTGEAPGTPLYRWGELYYGTLYDELVSIKHTYDPQHVFHHAMSLGAAP
ncbi:FAD-binding oxidoreductase [Burkholderia alba]|uniref:FAD-binding oxidoreductase n=1 Tax=Burkholderia alba TaxID=2683677 RepID=UPI002B05E1F3|nr:BBE domain-containing protein [Burkholderia alba]